MASIPQDFPCFYADDIALLADSAQQMQPMLFVCEKWARVSYDIQSEEV